MFERLLQHLRCPSCRSEFDVEVLSIVAPGSDAEISEGLLRCRDGDHWYPIVGGIPRLLPDAFETFAKEIRRFPLAPASTSAREALRRLGAERGQNSLLDWRTRDNFSLEWKHHHLGDRTWGMDLQFRVRKYFLDAIDQPVEELAGQLMLDAGCGNGSQSVAYTEFGLEVIAVDLSLGLEHGHAFRHVHPGARPDRVHFVQADLQHPPFAPGSVDLVHSVGVLHHTPDTERTFRALTPLVRDKGSFYLWLYKRERLVTPVVDGLRRVTTRVPPRAFAIVAQAGAEPFRLFCRAVNALGLRSYVAFSRREAALALFDIFGAPYAHAHTFSEVQAWLRSADFDDVWPCNETRRGFGACGRRVSA
ncbi:MAG: methyltransferase domain-containing protein [Solirubrobacteraceae bacterium]